MAALGQPASPVYWAELGKKLAISFYGILAAGRNWSIYFVIGEP